LAHRLARTEGPTAGRRDVLQQSITPFLAILLRQLGQCNVEVGELGIDRILSHLQNCSAPSATSGSELVFFRARFAGDVGTQCAPSVVDLHNCTATFHQSPNEVNRLASKGTLWIEMELPIYDAHGGSLVTFARLDDATPEGVDTETAPACAMVFVGWGHQVLLGFNVTRQQWELPGGSMEAGESAHDAAIRELAEETGIRVERVSLVARAACTFAGEATRYVAEVFAIVLDSAPDLVENDELHSFVWWDPASDEWEGLSHVDAEIARRCLPLPPSEVD